MISSDGGGARIGSFGTVLSQFQREDCDKAQACMSKHPAWPEDGWRRLYMVISGFVVWILLGFGPYDHIAPIYNLIHNNYETSRGGSS